MSFDLNIQNYGPDDIVALFKLPQNYCDADVDEKALAIRKQLFSEEMPGYLKEEISVFLDAARDMIKRDWVPQAPGREDLIPSAPIPNIPAKVEEFTKGDINPYAKRSLTKMASIDTLFRTNSSITPSTDFAYVLPESIRNVVSMRLASIEIPKNVINMFSGNNKSNLFRIRLYNVPGEDDCEVSLVIPNGNYAITEIETVINNLLVDNHIDYITFELLSSNRTRFRVSKPQNECFRFELDFVVEGKLLCASAGWNLGFRSATYEGTNCIASESTYGSGIDNYLFLEVDDFHNNFQTDTVISTNATSYMGKNILARVVLNTSSTIYQNTGNDCMYKKREYLGPVRIERLHFRLLNRFGEVVDITHNDFSFALEFVTIYS